MMLRLAADLPDRDDAREWAERELEKAVYRESEPTLFDRVARAIGDFLASLFNPQIGGATWSPVWTIVIVAILVAMIVVAFIIWGAPRGDHRAHRIPSSTVFDDDERSASDLRAAADAMMREGRWDDAVVLRFRAIARSAEERGVLMAPPGMTAQAFASAAASPFPDHRDELRAAAGTFDDVRYLRRPASAEAAERITALDRAVADTRPARTPEAAFS